MLKEWVGVFQKTNHVYLLTVVVAIYIVWYVVDALEGFDPGYKPTAMGLGDNESKAGTKIEGGAEKLMFDPTKKKTE
ncbi:MAG: hypothetical protein CM1200mP38_6750 [Dehalococcoidia bacterium]|nr:MAG: hypothetical protein CM1200mP38_6750 [Dehalococcoidia bacterium]